MKISDTWDDWIISNSQSKCRLLLGIFSGWSSEIRAVRVYDGQCLKIYWKAWLIRYAAEPSTKKTWYEDAPARHVVSSNIKPPDSFVLTKVQAFARWTSGCFICKLLGKTSYIHPMIEQWSYNVLAFEMYWYHYTILMKENFSYSSCNDRCRNKNLKWKKWD